MARDEETFPKVFERVKQLYKEGKVALSYHAGQKRNLRHIETPDLENLIRFGRMTEMRTALRHSSPSYTIEGTTVDNERIGCSVVIEGEILKIITAFWKDRPD